MFRKMRRFKQQISDEKCVEILTNEPRGVLALYGENGYPYALPLDHLYDDGKLYFHCAAEGHKIDAIKANPHASYCVMDEGFRKENEWALNINSVIVFGTIRFVTDKEQMLLLYLQPP
ncbi:MAG: pyridoxamine 5'-phosphate oxidase family protein [Ruminococcus sp.]|nr:pyridoxamine 5'-phosphate oxidase family protein [Ruminococcus sp.]